ncbi:MAG: hypothetical protein ACFB4I_17595 [Cyanophyceae cyanobacterium]
MQRKPTIVDDKYVQRVINELEQVCDSTECTPAELVEAVMCYVHDRTGDPDVLFAHSEQCVTWEHDLACKSERCQEAIVTASETGYVSEEIQDCWKDHVSDDGVLIW